MALDDRHASEVPGLLQVGLPHGEPHGMQPSQILQLTPLKVHDLECLNAKPGQVTKGRFEAFGKNLYGWSWHHYDPIRISRLGTTNNRRGLISKQ